MTRKRVRESLEEDEPSLNPTSASKGGLEDSDTGSDEDLSFPKKPLTSQIPANHHGTSDKSTEENALRSPPRKNRIVSRILGKKHNSNPTQPKLSTPPTSPPLPTAKPSPPEPVTIERVFHHSGVKKYNLQDGPVTLIPYESSHAQGGYGVRVTQNGVFVGLIAAGEEMNCRKLLVCSSITMLTKGDGWKSELRYLGGGHSEIVMRNR
jgi:hypothetical protein